MEEMPELYPFRHGTFIGLNGARLLGSAVVWRLTMTGKSPSAGWHPLVRTQILFYSPRTRDAREPRDWALVGRRVRGRGIRVWFPGEEEPRMLWPVERTTGLELQGVNPDPWKLPDEAPRSSGEAARVVRERAPKLYRALRETVALACGAMGAIAGQLVIQPPLWWRLRREAKWLGSFQLVEFAEQICLALLGLQSLEDVEKEVLQRLGSHPNSEEEDEEGEEGGV